MKQPNANFSGRPIVIDALLPDDNDAIAQAAAIMVEAFPHWTSTDALALEEVAAALEPGRVCLMATNGSDLLGWIGAMPAYSHAWELHPLAVRKDMRGQGIGRALVGELEKRVRLRGALTLYLGTDDDGPVPGTSAGGIDLFPDVLSHAMNLAVIEHAAGFYRRLGFEIVGLIPDASGPGKPDVLMAKRIHPASVTTIGDRSSESRP